MGALITISFIIFPNIRAVLALVLTLKGQEPASVPNQDDASITALQQWGKSHPQNQRADSSLQKFQSKSCKVVICLTKRKESSGYYTSQDDFLFQGGCHFPHAAFWKSCHGKLFHILFSPLEAHKGLLKHGSCKYAWMSGFWL